MACDSRYADANDFSTFWQIEVDEIYEDQINRILEMTATNIHVARLASDACDCTLSDAAAAFLVFLNVLLAGILFQNPCGPRLSDEEKRIYMEMATENLNQIRDGRLELCEGETGSEFPSIDIAQQSVTEFAAGRIIANDILRNS